MFTFSIARPKRKEKTQHSRRSEREKVLFFHAQLARIVLLLSSLHLATAKKKKKTNSNI